MKESWRDTIGFEGYYQVSDCGRVRSLDRLVRTRGQGMRLVPGNTLSLFMDKYGYMAVKLWKSNRGTGVRVHRLVLESFGNIGKQCGHSLECNHKDGNKSNNTVDNLEWVSNSENKKHSYRIGLRIPTNQYLCLR